MRPAWRWGLALGALAALVVLVAAVARPKSLSVQTTAVRRGNLLVPVQCDGTLEPPPGGELRAADAATVGALLVKSGDLFDYHRHVLAGSAQGHAGSGRFTLAPPPGKKACRVRLFRPFDDGTDNWEEGYAWLIATGQKLKRVFARDWD